MTRWATSTQTHPSAYGGAATGPGQAGREAGAVGGAGAYPLYTRDAYAWLLDLLTAQGRACEARELKAKYGAAGRK